MRNFSRVMTTALCALLATCMVMVATTRQAQARPAYLGWWTETYPKVAEENDVKKMVKCNVCHVGPKKKNRNAYGKALDHALTKKNLPKADKQVFIDALKKVADEKSQTEGKTFGDLLKANELPAKEK